MTKTVYAIDELVAVPGKGRELLEAYKARYVPGAEARGMTLDQVLVSAPVLPEKESNRQTIAWTDEGAPGWWGQATQGRYDQAAGAFWHSVEGLIASRHRHFAAAEDDVAELCHV